MPGTHDASPISALRFLAAITLGALAGVGCATTDARLGNVPDDPGFTPPPDAGSDVAVDASAAPLCVATECPAPYTTCPSEFGPTYACSVDLRRDAKHCGACGNECLSFEPIHMTSRCIDGGCALECQSLPKYVFPDGERPTKYENCNGLLDDGCEVDLFSDAASCGACGNACAPGTRCIDGQCGCPKGLLDCDGFCVDVSSNDASCGGCGVVCEPPANACDPLPPHAGYGCVGATCGKPKCDFGFEDCNGDLAIGCASDGCETSLLDPASCGACGKACAPGEECREQNLVIDCRPTCAASGKTACPSGTCEDLLNDPEQCGGCGLACPSAGPGQQRSCVKGVCVVGCVESFGDCNGDPTDGCETDLRAHPAHCGACGVACDLSVGQPCFEGRCLLGPCEDPVTN